jgi:uroporphyrinogen decarboxylase
MDRRERVQAALEGRRIDRIPYALWRHFYYQGQTAEGLAQATVGFYQRYGPDLIVLTPGPFYMAEAWGADIRSFNTDDLAPYIVSPAVPWVSDWRRLPALEVATSSLRREIDAVRQVRARLGDDPVALVVHLYSPLMTADLLCAGRIAEDVRSFSNDLRSGLGVIATATAQFARACMEAGADGFLFTTNLATTAKMRTREYRDFGQRYDLQVLGELKAAQIRILRLEGEHLLFDLAETYPVQAVCWETWRADPSLVSAGRQVRCSLMGGINPTTFASGSIGDVRDQIADATAQTGGWRFLLSPSGPLPPDSQSELLACVPGILDELPGRS